MSRIDILERILLGSLGAITESESIRDVKTEPDLKKITHLCHNLKETIESIELSKKEFISYT